MEVIINEIFQKTYFITELIKIYFHIIITSIEIIWCYNKTIHISKLDDYINDFKYSISSLFRQSSSYYTTVRK